jgi:hypothetical protein
MAPLGGENDHTTAFNREGRWCSNEEMVPDVRRRDWSRVGAVDNGCTFYRVIGRRKAGGQGERGSGSETSMVLVTEMETGKGR